jgi:hypothetical protein
MNPAGSAQGLAGSRLLARLDADLRRALHPIDRACLRAERAAQLARHGQYDAASNEITALHATFDRQPSVAVSAWLCLAEGCLAYFTSLSGSARDKMQRAQALSAAARLPRIHALSVAWLAHMDYVHLDAESTAKHVRLALSLAEPGELAALARACLVVGMALQYAERNDLAQPWYARARECASLEGDEATLSALVFNMAWHHGNHALQASIFGGEFEARARHAMLGADSTENIGRWQGIISLDALVPMLRAQVHSVQGRHACALALYQANWLAAKRQGLGRMAANFLADMAWCRWSTGDVTGALQDACAAAAAIDPAMHADDQAVAHGRLAQLMRAAGEVDQALHHEGRARDCWGVHQRLQARFVDQLGGIPLPARRTDGAGSQPAAPGGAQPRVRTRPC